MLIVNPKQLQETAVEEKPSIGCPLARVRVRGAFDQTCVQQSAGFWRAHRRADEDVMNVERHSCRLKSYLASAGIRLGANPD